MAAVCAAHAAAHAAHRKHEADRKHQHDSRHHHHKSDVSRHQSADVSRHHSDDGDAKGGIRLPPINGDSTDDGFINGDHGETAPEPEPKEPEPPQRGIWKYQEKAGTYYKNTKTEIFVAGLIVGNFFTNMLEKTVDPDPDNRSLEAVWVFFEYFYNILFAIELAVNMYAFWLRPFWSSGWNVFDFMVVSIGMCSVFKIPLPGPLKLLRMMRAFRVFRLFKRVKSLKKIMTSLAKAVPGVINAFIIQIIVMCIYAMLGVEFFRHYGDGGTFLNEEGEAIELKTARGQDWGWEYFGNFPKSLFTMFQVLTGESWSEAICRPLTHGKDWLQSTLFALFFVSFVVLNGVVLINVVVAVLLDKMVDDPNAAENEADDSVKEPSDVDTVHEMMGLGSQEEVRESNINDLHAGVAALKEDMAFIQERIKHVLIMMQSRRPLDKGLIPPDWISGPGNQPPEMFVEPGAQISPLMKPRVADGKAPEMYVDQILEIPNSTQHDGTKDRESRTLSRTPTSDINGETDAELPGRVSS